MFNKEEFDQFLMENDVVTIGEEETELKSGRMSNWYANCRVLTDFTKNTGILVKHVLDFVSEKELELDYFYGVPEGATKLGLMLTNDYAIQKAKNLPLVMGRGKPKDHGQPRDKYFVGPVKEGDKVIVVEDVTTTGGSLISTIKNLKEAGVQIVAALALVNRQEFAKDLEGDMNKGINEILEEMGVKYYALSDATRLLPLAIAKQKPTPMAIEKVKSYFQKYSSVKLDLR